MEQPSGFENQSDGPSLKTKSKRKKLLKFVEASLAVNDSFTRQFSNENFADNTSKESAENETRSEIQTANTTYSSCCSTENTNLMETNSGYSADGTISSESCSSFAIKNRLGKNPKRMSVYRKKRFENIISRTLADSLDLDVDLVAEKDETVKSAISDQELRGSLTSSESQSADATYYSCYSNDNADLTQSVSMWSGYGTAGSETGSSLLPVSGRPGKNPKKKTAECRKRYVKVISSALGDGLDWGLGISEVDETVDQRPPISNNEPTGNPKADELDMWKSSMSKATSAMKKDMASADGESGGVCLKETAMFASKSDVTNTLQSFFDSLRARDVSNIKTAYPVGSITLLLDKEEEVVKKSPTDVVDSCDLPDAITLSQLVTDDTTLQSRPFGCFENFSLEHVSSISKGVSSASKGVSLTSKDVSSASKGVSSTSKGVSSASKGVSSASKGVSSASKGVSSASKGVSSASKGVSSASKGVSSASKGVSSASKGVSMTSKDVSATLSTSNCVSSGSKDVSSGSKDVSSTSKAVSVASKVVSSSSKGAPLISKDISSASKDVSSTLKGISLSSKGASSASKAELVEMFPLSRVNRIVRYVVMQDVCIQTDETSDCSIGKSLTDASVQADLCHCPRLTGCHSSTNIGPLSQQNLSRSEKVCKDSGDKFFTSGNHLSKTGDSSCSVPTSPGKLYKGAKTKKTTALHSNDVKANNDSICSKEVESSETLGQMFSKIGLSDSRKILPDRSVEPSKRNESRDAFVPKKPEGVLIKAEDCNPDFTDIYAGGSLIDDKKTESKALDRNERRTEDDDDVCSERLDVSLQVSFALDDDMTDGSFSRLNPLDVTESYDVLNNLCNDSDPSGAASGSNDTIIYLTSDAPDLETADESSFSDKVEKSESAECVNRAPVHCVKTEAGEWEGEESLNRVNESVDESGNENSSTCDDDDETDVRSISLQVSLSDDDDVSDESDTADHLWTRDQLEFDKKPPKENKDTSVKNGVGGKNLSNLDRNASDLTDLVDKSNSAVSDPDDLIVPDSPPLSQSADLSLCSPADVGEQQIEQMSNERQATLSLDTPLQPSLMHGPRNISLQVSLSSDGFNNTPANDRRMSDDYDRDDLDCKPPALKEIISSLHENPSTHQNSNQTMNCLFDLSDEEQQSDDVVERSDPCLSDVPQRVLCSTFLGRPSLESVQRSDHSWVMSPVRTETPLSINRRKSKSMRRVSLLAGNKESTSDSYASANGSVLVVPDTSESDDEQGALYKTAYVECGAVEGFVVQDSSASQVHVSRDKSGQTTEVFNVSDSQDSSDDDDDDFENFLERVKTTDKIAKFSPPAALDDFIVDDCEAEVERGDKEEVDEEEEGEEAFNDVIIDDDDDDVGDDRVFYYQVDNEREEQDNIDALSSRLGKALNFSLTSDSSDDDDFQVLPKRKVVVKKLSKVLTRSSDEENDKAAANIFHTPAPESGAIFRTPAPESGAMFRTPAPGAAGIFRTPAPVVSKRRVLSVITPQTSSSNSVFGDNQRIIPHTVGHAPLPRLSFLKSLSADVKEFLRDAKAARYVKNFKSLRSELTAELFALFNQKVFDSKIPSDMNVVWNERLRRTAGFCRSRLTKDNPPKRLAAIELSVKVCDSTDRLRDTLIHEMCHAIVWLEHGSREVHGPIWKFWATKANRALPDLPPITRCHSYDINTKFVYKCVKCGYEIGRHSKSLDTEKKICGHCRGQFELLVRPRNGSRPDSVPTTPRTPNKFALFVKESYGDIKKTRPGVTHKEIMEMIATRYSARKEMLLGDD